MWLELLRFIQPNFTADAPELGMNNFPTYHPWRAPRAAAPLCESVLGVVKLL